MDQPPAQDYLRPYREAVRRHGPGFEATLWSSPEGQRRRFDVMIDLAGFENCTLVDIGCGQGDFAKYLVDREIRFARFVGIDALPELIAAAQQRNLPRCEFRVCDALADPAALACEHADFICFSGSLNTMDECVAKALVQRTFDAAAQGVVFNFLSDRPHERWSHHPLEPARRFDTIDWLNWALDLTSRVTFTQDYLDGHDATILLRHDK